MDAGEMINRKGQALVVTRRAKVKRIAGRDQPPASSELPIVAVVYPASGRDLLRLPEGRRSEEARTLITATQLLVGYQGSPNESDLVAMDGQPWEVQHCEQWPGLPTDAGAFYRAVAQARR